MNEEKQTNKKINRDALKWVVIGLAGLAVIVLIFGLGIAVGGMKARFSYHWAENYHQNFAGPQTGFLRDWRNVFPLTEEFIEGHGIFGEIIELKDDKSFVIKGRGDIEKVVITAEDTVIKKEMKTVEDGLKVGDDVVIIGSPNDDGQIEAKLIRVFDSKLKGAPTSLRAPQELFF